MKLLGRVYDLLILALAWWAGGAIVATFLAIIADVVMRNLGMRSPAFTSALSEYAMLVATMAAAPMIVRERGHVWVEVIQSFASGRLLRVSGLMAILFCIGICVIMSWYSVAIAFEAAGRGEVDIRSIILPRWFLYAVLAVGFGLCATEFARFLVKREDMFARRGEEG